MNSLISIVIVNFNSLFDVRRCLGSLGKLESGGFSVCVVDNGSTDGSRGELMRIEDERVKVIFAEENKGFAAGCNVGIREAVKDGAEFVWLLNPDTEVKSGALKAFVDAAKKYSDGGAFGSKVLCGDDEGKIWSAGGWVDYVKKEVGMYGSGEEDRGQYEVVRECDYLPGCSLFFRTSILEKVGYLPEEYFMYFEETAWCEAIRKKGLPLYYVPQSVVVHHFDNAKMQKPFCIYYYNRNNLYFWFARSSFLEKLKTLYRVLFKKLPELKNALAHAPNDELREVFRAHLVAHRDFLFLILPFLQKRSFNKQLRI